MNIPFYTMTKKGLKIWQMTLTNSLMTHLHQFDYLKPYTPLKAEHFEQKAEVNLLYRIKTSSESKHLSHYFSHSQNFFSLHLERLKHKNLINSHCKTLQHRADNPFPIAILKNIGVKRIKPHQNNGNNYFHVKYHIR